MDDALHALRTKVALACRILAANGVMGDITGHVSARIPGTDEMLIRCRGDAEEGIAYTTPEAVRRLTFDGAGDDVGPEHERPLELPIHGEVLRARPEVGAVVHAHPPAVLLCGLAGIELRPVFGAFDPGALSLAIAGIPVYPRSVLIRTPALGREVVAAMGDRDVCILRGHGIVVAGATVEQATLRAIRLEQLARICWQLAQRGPLRDIPPEDLAEFADYRAGRALPRADEWAWRYQVRRLGEPGALP